MKSQKQTIKKITQIIPFFHYKKTAGQKAADAATKFAGSWTYFFLLIAFILVWLGVNVIAIEQQWDPYPFILLNFVISCVALLQAPLILMSQKRTTDQDRKYMKYDFEINKKAENEIRDMQKDLEEIKRLIKNKRA